MKTLPDPEPKINESGPLQIAKLATGIEGFDDITGGGLPLSRASLLMGGAGCGKTVLALEILVNGARLHQRPGIFVAFEENVAQVEANAATFGWNVHGEGQAELFLVDACLRTDVIKAGPFDLTGLLAALATKARKIGAKVIVFDAIDALLRLLDNPAAESHELYRIHEWLNDQALTGILTTKIEETDPAAAQRYGFMPFMVDCAVLLNQRVMERVTVRTLRILKYRGSAHVLSEVPFTIGPAGLEVGSSNGIHPEPQPFSERVSTGVQELDAMLAGGFYRGTNALITGSSGTGKTMLAGAFMKGACSQNERALFISFDENSCDIVRDLAAMNMDIAPYAKSGLLRLESVRSESASSEEHFMRIKRMIGEHQPSCVVMDPLSALARVGGGMAARAVAERLIYLCRNAGITVLLTSLMEGGDPQLETTMLHISTISDSWIQVTYELQDGERNRALSIIKSRGSAHSNRLRELVFSDQGITLAKPFLEGGRVLMGSLRVAREAELHTERERRREEIEEQRRTMKTTIRERDQHLVTANRNLQKRLDELEKLNSPEGRHQITARRDKGDGVQPPADGAHQEEAIGSNAPGKEKKSAKSK